MLSSWLQLQSTWYEIAMRTERRNEVSLVIFQVTPCREAIQTVHKAITKQSKQVQVVEKANWYISGIRQGNAETDRIKEIRHSIYAYLETVSLKINDRRFKEVHGKINCLGKASTIRQRRHEPERKRDRQRSEVDTAQFMYRNAREARHENEKSRAA